MSRIIYNFLTPFLLLSISTHLSANIGPVFDKSLRKIESSFIELCQSNQFSGALLIAIHGKVRFKNACGLANRDFNVPNTVQTKFNLGSVGKLFTSTAISRLIAQKKLSLNTRASKIIPRWLTMPNGDLITIEQLLTHQSGLGNFMEDERWKLGADSGLYNTIKDYRPLIANKPLLFKPGLSQLYSNSGYLVLGAVIEELSHQSYPEYITEHIFNVANMKDTGIFPLDDVVNKRAVGYFFKCRQKACQWKNNNFSAPFIGTSAGGAYSTVEDLFKFSHFIFQNEFSLFSTKVTATRDHIQLKSFKFGQMDIPEHVSSYGFAGAWNQYGFAVWNNPNIIGHTGGVRGAEAIFAVSPDNLYTIIILSNLDNGATFLYKKIREALEFKGGIENF